MNNLKDWLRYILLSARQTDQLFLPEIHYGLGGPKTFYSNIQQILAQNSFPYHQNSYLGCRAIFFPIEWDIHRIKVYKQTGAKIIQRLDGVYYPSKHGDQWELKNQNIRYIYENLSDWIVFQSEYCRKQCEHVMGTNYAAQSKIIINGADHNLYYPEKDQESPSGKWELITTGNFRNRDMIEPVVLALDQVQKTHHFELTCVGPISNSDIAHFFQRDYIRHIKQLDSKEIAQYLRESDVFIYSHLNPPCPNSVIEAVSSALPVVGFDSGSMSEICFFNKDLLAPVSDQVIHEEKDFKSEVLAASIFLCLNHYSHFREVALKNANLYSWEKMGDAYLELFREAMA